MYCVIESVGSVFNYSGVNLLTVDRVQWLHQLTYEIFPSEYLSPVLSICWTELSFPSH
jgi:hypothetical protein